MKTYYDIFTELSCLCDVVNENEGKCKMHYSRDVITFN